jgi:hypothetical protein
MRFATGKEEEPILFHPDFCTSCRNPGEEDKKYPAAGGSGVHRVKRPVRMPTT